MLGAVWLPCGGSSCGSTSTGEAHDDEHPTPSAGGPSWPEPGPWPWARPARQGGLRSAPSGDSGDPHRPAPGPQLAPVHRHHRRRRDRHRRPVQHPDGDVGRLRRGLQRQPVRPEPRCSDPRCSRTSPPASTSSSPPTGWCRSCLERGLLEPIPLEHVPNHVNVDPPSWAPPGTGAPASTCRGRRASPASPTTRPSPAVTSALRRAARPRAQGPGRDGHRDAGGRRAAHAGPGRRPGPGHRRPAAEAALDKLEAIVAKGQVRPDSPATSSATPSRQASSPPAWRGRATSSSSRPTRPDIRFVIPDEGGIRWFDSMVIPKGADNVPAAGELDELRLRPGQRGPHHRRRPVREPGDRRAGRTRRPGARRRHWPTTRSCSPTSETRRRLFFWAGLDEATEEELQARFAAITGPLVDQS